MDNGHFLCPMCEKQVFLREDAYVVENGEAVHTGCYVKRILQETRITPSEPAIVAPRFDLPN